MNSGRGLFRVWASLSVIWIISMGIAVACNGVPEPTSEFKVTAPLDEKLLVIAPAHLSKDDVLAYVKKNYTPVLNCHDNMWACRDPILLKMPLRTIRPRAGLYLALAVAVPAIALIFGFGMASVIFRFAPDDRRFGNTLVVSFVLAVLAVLAEVAVALTFATAADQIGRSAGQFSLVCCMLCAVLFVVGLILFRRKGLWLAVPLIVAWALPVYFITDFTIEMDACLKQPNHPMCVP